MKKVMSIIADALVAIALEDVVSVVDVPAFDPVGAEPNPELKKVGANPM